MPLKAIFSLFFQSLEIRIDYDDILFTNEAILEIVKSLPPSMRTLDIFSQRGMYYYEYSRDDRAEDPLNLIKMFKSDVKMFENLTFISIGCYAYDLSKSYDSIGTLELEDFEPNEISALPNATFIILKGNIIEGGYFNKFSQH